MCVRLLGNGAREQAIISVLTMACLGSARLCARVGHIRRKPPGTLVDNLVRAAFFKVGFSIRHAIYFQCFFIIWLSFWFTHIDSKYFFSVYPDLCFKYDLMICIF